MKNALITGGSRGIGRETALLLSQNGFRVAVCYHKSDSEAQSLREEIISQGGECDIYKCDVASYEQTHRMAEEIQGKWGETDLLVNNAGISEQLLFTDITEEKWDRMFDVNVKGVYNCTHAVLGGMIHKKQGRIVNISSMWGEVGASCEVHYSASKSAVIGFTKALAKEVGLSGITVNCIAPGVIGTDMIYGQLDGETIEVLKEETPLSAIGAPYDIASAVLFLASEGASFITGQVLGVNGGFVI